MSRILTRTALIGSGIMLGLIGGALVLAPKTFLEMSHVFVEQDPSLMSEIAAPSGVLLITSAFMTLGAFNLRFSNLGLVMGAIVYGSYGVGRLFSVALHGVPSESLIAATVVELGVAILLIALRLTAPSAKQWNMVGAYSGEVTV